MNHYNKSNIDKFTHVCVHNKRIKVIKLVIAVLPCTYYVQLVITKDFIFFTILSILIARAVHIVLSQIILIIRLYLI